MVRSPQLLAHLSRVQHASHADVRVVLPLLPHQRTVSRWYRELGDQLVVFPTFAFSSLGLGHVHVFLTDADESWLRFPYAVDHAWLTQDFARRVLYLHCIVPLPHHDAVLEFLRDFARTEPTVVATGEGWQDLPLLGTSPCVTTSPACTDVLREFPLVIPVIFEGWNQRSSTRQLWRRVRLRLGQQLHEYAPRRRRRVLSPVTTAYERLTDEGLFRQHTIRYAAPGEDRVEVLAIVDNPLLLGPLRQHARAIEVYAGTLTVVRLVGTGRLLDALLSLPVGAARLYFVHKKDDQRVRFCYEHLFAPRTGSWVFSRDRLLRYLWGNT